MEDAACTTRSVVRPTNRFVDATRNDIPKHQVTAPTANPAMRMPSLGASENPVSTGIRPLPTPPKRRYRKGLRRRRPSPSQNGGAQRMYSL